MCRGTRRNCLEGSDLGRSEKWRRRPVSESVEAVRGGALAGGGVFRHGESRKKRGGVDGGADESKKW